MNRKLSALAVAAVLAGSGLAGCGSSMDVQGYGTSAQVNAAVLTAAREWDPQARTDTELERSDTRSRFLSVLNELRDVPQLAPLWDLYGIANPITTEDDDHCSGLIRLLKEVRFTVRDGRVRITNRATGGVIFTAPRADLASGTFSEANLPGGSGGGGAVCASFTYSAWGACGAGGTQTRTVVSSSPAGCTGGSPVTSQACTPPPAGGGTCTSFTYSAWSACGAAGTQTRTVLSSAPAGCSGGAPVTSQACTPAPSGATLYGASCAGCHGALATSNLRGVGISLSLINQKNMRQGLTDAQLQAIVTAVGP